MTDRTTAPTHRQPDQNEYGQVRVVPPGGPPAANATPRTRDQAEGRPVEPEQLGRSAADNPEQGGGCAQAAHAETRERDVP